MALFWFLLALVLLVVALVILRLDAQQRGGRSRGRRAAVSDGSVPSSGEGAEDTGADDDAAADDDDADEAPHPAPPAGGDEAPDESASDTGAPKPAPFQRAAGAGDDADAGPDTTPVADTAPVADDEAPAAATASDEAAASSEPAVESSPRLLDRVRGLLPARRTGGRAAEPVEAEPVDPLAGSPVVRWLEDREFAPTPTPAPEFRHGDFAGGLSALGTVSHGVFRGRRAIMGVTGGRTVLALRRDTASDVVLDLSRPDVDAEPGFHDAGEVGVLEARTSDLGRLDLLDRDRLADSVRNVPASVRRIWAEGEWVAATIDGVDDPSGWDDVVMALHGVADVVAPFPPIGGRARALPAEIDPGAPAAADGPEADPTTGMDGEAGTGTHEAAPLPGSRDDVVVDTPTATTAPDAAQSGQPGQPEQPVQSVQSVQSGPLAKRAGHLRLVPDRPAARDLTDVPVKADRGDAPAETGTEEPAVDEAGTEEPAVDEATGTEAPGTEDADPFAEIMESTGHVESRGDVAADHLEPRPPLSRPSRGAGQSFPEDATVPPLAARVPDGGAGIKPLGSEDDEDEIRDEVERFDAARIDGGSDLDESTSGRHGAPPRASGGRHGVEDVDPSEVTQKLSVAELAARMGIDPSEMKSSGRRRRRRAEPDEGGPAPDATADSGAQGRERPGIDPDVERTTRIVFPPDVEDGPDIED